MDLKMTMRFLHSIFIGFVLGVSRLEQGLNAQTSRPVDSSPPQAIWVPPGITVRKDQFFMMYAKHFGLGPNDTFIVNSRIICFGG